MNAPADIAWSRQLAGTSRGQVSLWAAAAVVMLSTHVAAAWWALREPPPPSAAAETQAAIMIDLAPTPVAPEAAEDEIATDAQDSAGVEAPPTMQPVKPNDVATPVTEDIETLSEETPLESVQPVRQETAQPVTEPAEERLASVTPETAEPVRPDRTATATTPVEERAEPVKQQAAVRPLEPEAASPVEPEVALPVQPDEIERLEEVVDPVERMIVEELERVETPLPTARPDPPPPVKQARAEPKPEQPRRQAPPKRQAAPSPETRKGAVQAERADRAAAQQTSRGAASSVSPARWQSRLLAHLERRKRYPDSARRARKQGTAYVRFSIDANGNVGSVALARSSGISELDEEVVAMVRRASPVPAPPPGVNRTIMVPVRFSLR
ncbi:MAG: TonB family protein [Rhizobiaceae bacterium]|nr:TonB family protein [Rhizobiaceae bacterium]MCV0407151.1 TonB family protein [Rhizobiaceae bacterium]